MQKIIQIGYYFGLLVKHKSINKYFKSVNIIIITTLRQLIEISQCFNLT